MCQQEGGSHVMAHHRVQIDLYEWEYMTSARKVMRAEQIVCQQISSVSCRNRL